MIESHKSEFSVEVNGYVIHCVSRYVNAGEKNKVNMSVLRSQIAGIGYENVTTYINSGNVFIRTDDDITSVSDNLAQMLNEKYEFDIPFVIVTQEDYQSEILPEWWEKDMFRKSAIFFIGEGTMEAVKKNVKTYPLLNEHVTFGNNTLFWGIQNEKELGRSAYTKYLIKDELFQKMTVRTSGTFDNIKKKLK